jgi:hypothetical protein
MVEKVQVNFNIIESAKNAVAKDPDTFFAGQLFDLCLRVEEYADIFTKLLRGVKGFQDDSTWPKLHFMINARVETEISAIVLEKAHPIFVNTTYLVRNLKHNHKKLYFSIDQYKDLRHVYVLASRHYHQH